jgi:hypothetical protein
VVAVTVFWHLIPYHWIDRCHVLDAAQCTFEDIVPRHFVNTSCSNVRSNSRQTLCTAVSTGTKYRIYSRNLRTFFPSLDAEKSGCVKYADFFCGGLDPGFILA